MVFEGVYIIDHGGYFDIVETVVHVDEIESGDVGAGGLVGIAAFLRIEEFNAYIGIGSDLGKPDEAEVGAHFVVVCEVVIVDSSEVGAYHNAAGEGADLLLTVNVLGICFLCSRQ